MTMSETSNTKYHYTFRLLKSKKFENFINCRTVFFFFLKFLQLFLFKKNLFKIT